MFITPVLRGAKFGHLAKVHGIVTYSISPFEQKAFPNFFSKAVPNTLRRIRESMIYVVPPFALGFLVFELVEQRHKELQRKDPKEFENDE